MDYADILYEQIGPVVRISHNRPEKRNAESERLLAELDDALLRSAADDTVRVVIIAGTGDHFSAGHDLNDGMKNRGDYTPEQHWVWELEHYYGNALRIWDHPKPVIAQVQGACIAGGFMVANMCDLVVASEDAFFSDPVVHSLGVAAVEVLCHPWVMGLRKAKEFLFTGERITAAQAEHYGLVNRVVPRAELEAATLRLAERIAAAPPSAIRMMKRSLNRTADMQGFRNSLSAHFDTHVLAQSSFEHKEIVRQGMQASLNTAKAG